MTNPEIDSKLPDAGVEKPDSKVEWGDYAKQIFSAEILDLMTSIIYSSKNKSALDFENYFWGESQGKVKLVLEEKLKRDIFEYLFEKQIKRRGRKTLTKIRIKKDIGRFMGQIYHIMALYFSKNTNLKKVSSDLTRSISAYLIAILVKWKHSRLSGDQNAQNFYTVAENDEFRKKYQGTEVGYFIESYHHLLILKEFLKECSVEIPLKGEKLKEINQKLAELIKKEQIRGIPMVISQNETFSKTPILFQINDIPSSASISSTAFAHINLYGPKTSSIVRNDSDFLNQLGTCLPCSSEDVTYFVGIKNGDMGTFKVLKSMEIETPNIDHQSLKFFLRQQGDTDDSAYEAIRFNILLKIAEMTVDQARLMEVLDGIIEFPQPNFPEEKEAEPRKPSKPQERDESNQKIPSRYYPRMLLHRPKTAEKAEDDTEKRKIVINHRVYHRRLLPVGDRPSQQAQELAQKNTITLGIAVQMPDFVVIKQDMLEAEAKYYAISEEQCVQDLVALGGQIRYYTFVREFKRPGIETKPIVEGRFGGKIIGAPEAELEGGIEEIREKVILASTTADKCPESAPSNSP